MKNRTKSNVSSISVLIEADLWHDLLGGIQSLLKYLKKNQNQSELLITLKASKSVFWHARVCRRRRLVCLSFVGKSVLLEMGKS